MQVKLLEGKGFGSLMLADFLGNAVEAPPAASVKNAVRTSPFPLSSSPSALPNLHHVVPRKILLLSRSYLPTQCDLQKWQSCQRHRSPPLS